MTENIKNIDIHYSNGASSRILDTVANSEPFTRLLEKITGGDSVSVGELPGSLLSTLIASLARINSIIVVTPDSSRGEALLDDLFPLLGEDDICFLPPDPSAQHSRISTEASEHYRAEALRRIAQNPPRCLVTLPGTLTEKFPTPKSLQDNLLALRKGIDIDPHELVRRMMNAGFKREVQVEGCGELALRGGILDLFPFGQRNPFRLEFWGNEIVSLREFDARSQRSIKELEEIRLLLSRRVRETGNVFDLMDGIVFWDDFDEIESRYQKLIESDISPLYLLSEKRPSIAYSPLLKADISFGGEAPQMFIGSEENFIHRCEKHLKTGWRVMVGVESPYRKERLMESLLSRNEGVIDKISVGILPLQKGFLYPAGKLAFYTERELYDRPRPRRSFAKFRTYAHPVEPEALKKGDYVVHVDYGIGVFEGLKTIKVAGHERECLHLKYRDNVSLYVRLEAFTKVQKYAGREGFVPSVTKIGGREWERTRKRTKEALMEMARELIVLQAKRQVKHGFAFARDDIWQKQMEDAFLYQDTPDQRRAAAEIKGDMEQDKPMDRLLLGDVGFGKTEVAVRAAFKAIQSNKQVAVLAPTTILVQQHTLTFKDRMSSFPIVVESLSRFRSPADQRKIVQGLRQGTVDVAIGTHRLLSKDVVFRKLGLVIIDEEHRFGVKHKEKLKKLREEVDVLTLTATPIPRTLHMALAGARDMSRIETPPADRLPIVTEIVPFDQGVIRESIMYELKRGGQVFFVHNRVRSIEAVSAMLARVAPEARFGIAHGQMSTHTLEKVMLEFMEKKIDCLVCTMIIESGLDMPNVNTMIINRADKLGLAQLYQLRGRIGRSDRQAFAYLLIPPKLSLTKQARSRLETISEFTELGAGFQVALKDLEIRGAGNLLGQQQSGFINSIGFDMYSDLLEEAVREVKMDQGLAVEKEIKLASRAMENGMKVEFAGDAYIPADFVEDENLRVNFYRKMSRYGTIEELEKLEVEIKDRFGVIPEPLINLFGTLKLKLSALSKGITSIDVRINALILELQPKNYRKLLETAVKAAGDMQIEFLQEPAFTLKLQLDNQVSHAERLKTSNDFVIQLMTE